MVTRWPQGNFMVGYPRWSHQFFLLYICDDSRCGWYSEVIIWHLQYMMPGNSQSSVYEELAPSCFLCKTVCSLQRAFFNLQGALFYLFFFFWDWASKISQFGVGYYSPILQMRNGRRFGDLCKIFGWSQCESDKSGHLIHDCAFQCASSFNTNGIFCVYRSRDSFSHYSNFSLTSDLSVLSPIWESWPEDSGICCLCGYLGQRLGQLFLISLRS